MFTSFLTGKLLAIGAASAIAVGVLGAGTMVMADEPDPGTAHHHGDHPAIKGIVIGHVLQSSGVSKEELRQGAAEGKTFGEIITTYGDKSIAQAKADALAALEPRVHEAVANGNLPAERGQAILDGAPAAFDRLMAAKPGNHHGGHDRPEKTKFVAIGKHSLQTVADVLGIDVKDLAARMRGGASIASIAGDRTPAVIAALTADANSAIEKAVADGKVPPEKEQAAKEKAAAGIERFVNAEHTGKHRGR